MTNLLMVIATGCYAGYLPIAPGTWGSLLGLGLFIPLSVLGLKYYLVFLVVLFGIAVVSAGAAEKILDRKDPGEVVIDEVTGMLITLCGAPDNLLALLLGFLFFRIFDILKPFPVGWVDKRMNGGLGIVLDDVLAGIYGLLTLQIVWRLFGL